MAESKVSSLFQPCEGATSGKYVADIVLAPRLVKALRFATPVRVDSLFLRPPESLLVALESVEDMDAGESVGTGTA